MNEFTGDLMILPKQKAQKKRDGHSSNVSVMKSEIASSVLLQRVSKKEFNQE